MIGIGLSVAKSSGILAQQGGGEPVLSNDTSLSVFTIDGELVTNGGSITLPNGTSSVTVVAIPTHPNATVGPITGDTGLNTGDNNIFFTVTAEDGVTTEDYGLALRVLTAGVAEQTLFNGFNTGSYFATASAGRSFVISNADNRLGVWYDALNGETQPDLSAYGVTQYVRIEVDASDDDLTVASKFSSVMSSNGFSTSGSGSVITLTDNSIGSRQDAVDIDSGSSVSVLVDGEDPS